MQPISIPLTKKTTTSTTTDTEALKQAVVNGLTDVIFVLTPDGVIQSLNPAFEKTLGYSIADYEGREFFPLIYPEDLGKAVAALEKVLGGEHLGTFELRAVSRSGEVIPFEVNPTALRVEGMVTAVIGVGRDIRPRKEAEKETAIRLEERMARLQAEESEQKYRELAEALPEIVWTATPEGLVDYANAHWQLLTGFTERQGFGEGWKSAVHPDDRQRVSSSWNDSVAAGKPHQIQYRVRTREGNYRWHLVRAQPLRGENNEIRKWVGSCTDIHEQVCSQLALARSEERFRIISHSMSDQVWDWDILSNRVERNLGSASHYGYDPQDMVPSIEWWRSRLHPEDRERVLASINVALESGRNQWEEEFRYRRKDGSYSIVLDRGFIVRDPSGKAIRMIGTMSDVTESRRAQKELRRIKFISDNASDAHLIFDHTGCFIYVNTVACEHLGYSDQEFRALSFKDIDPTFDSKVPFHERFQSLQQSPPPPFESLIRRKDGSVFPVEISAMAFQFEGESFICAVIRDITERKKAEQELRNKTEGLARSNAELEQFAYVASHDLKEPLRMVNSYLQLLDRRCGALIEGDNREYLRYAVEGAERMYVLIDDLLAYSRVGTRGERYDLVDLNEVLDISITNLETSIRENAATIVRSPMPKIIADKTQMVQVFQNLIGNALKFRSTTSPHIDVVVEERGGEWLVSVSDNGIGIDSSYADKIFVIFQRLHTRDRYPGTGIGLAICKKIVDRHGGKIWVESDGKTGSIFRYTLPKKLSRKTKAI